MAHEGSTSLPRAEPRSVGAVGPARRRADRRRHVGAARCRRRPAAHLERGLGPPQPRRWTSSESRFAFSRAGVPCATDVGEPWLTERLGLPYLSFDVTATLPDGWRRRHHVVALLRRDDSHRVLLSLASGGRRSTARCRPSSREWTAPAANCRLAHGPDFRAARASGTCGSATTTCCSCCSCSCRRSASRGAGTPGRVAGDRARSRARRDGIHHRALDHARACRHRARAAAAAAGRSRRSRPRSCWLRCSTWRPRSRGCGCRSHSASAWCTDSGSRMRSPGSGRAAPRCRCWRDSTSASSSRTSP